MFEIQPCCVNETDPRKSLLFEQIQADSICLHSTSAEVCLKGHKFFTGLQCINGLPPILSIVKSEVNLHQECALFLFCLSTEDINQGFLGNNFLVYQLKL